MLVICALLEPQCRVVLYYYYVTTLPVELQFFQGDLLCSMPYIDYTYEFMRFFYQVLFKGFTSWLGTHF